MKAYLLLFFLFCVFNNATASNCRPDHYHGYGAGYDGYLELVESGEISNAQSLLIWWKEGEPIDGCDTEKCEAKYYGFSTFSKEGMFKEAKTVIRRKKADTYLLVWEDEIIKQDEKIPVLKMSLGGPHKALSNDIAMEYPPLKNEKGYLLYPENFIELGCGINLLK